MQTRHRHTPPRPEPKTPARRGVVRDILDFARELHDSGYCGR